MISILFYLGDSNIGYVLMFPVLHATHRGHFLGAATVKNNDKFNRTQNFEFLLPRTI